MNQVSEIALLPSFVPHQRYQVGGVRYEVISVTPEDGTFDDVLVLKAEDGGAQHIKMATEFLALKPELVH